MSKFKDRQTAAYLAKNGWKYDVFLLYAGANKEFVSKLYWDLYSNGILPFFYQESLELGDDADEVIMDALDVSSRFVVPILTHELKGKPWPGHELDKALVRYDKERKKQNSLILPVFFTLNADQCNESTNTSLKEISQITGIEKKSEDEEAFLRQVSSAIQNVVRRDTLSRQVSEDEADSGRPANASHRETILEYASKVRMLADRLGGFWEGWSQIPVEVFHQVCGVGAVKPYRLAELLEVSRLDLMEKPKAETPMQAVRQIIEIWMSRQREDATLERLFAALEDMQLLTSLKRTLERNIGESGASSGSSSEKKAEFERAMLDGEVDVEYVNIKVVGRDGAGKSRFADSLADKDFSKRPTIDTSTETVTTSTEIVEVRTMMTSSNGWKEADQPSDTENHVDKTLARGIVDYRPKSPTQDDTVPFDTQARNETVPILPRGSEIDPDGSQIPAAKRRREENEEMLSNMSVYDEEEMSSLVEKFRNDPEIMRAEKAVQVMQVWDIPGQKVFWIILSVLLLVQPSPFNFNVVMLVFNLCHMLNSKARCSVFVDGQHGSLPQEEHVLRPWVESEGDFISYFLTLLQVAGTNCSNIIIEGVKLPAVFGIGTHADLQEARENIQEQSEQFTEIVDASGYSDHLVFPNVDDHDKENMFCVDNTKSGQGEKQSRDSTVAEVCRRVQGMSREFFKKHGRRVKLKYVRLLKIILKLFETCGMCKVSKVKGLARELCGIVDAKQFLEALQFVSSIAFALFFSEIEQLNEWVISPQWLFNVQAAFVTVKRPNKQFNKDWKTVKSTGIMSWKLAQHLFEKQKVKKDEYPVVLLLFSHLGLLSPRITDERNFGMMPSVTVGNDFFVPFLIEEDEPWAGLAMSDFASMKDAVLPPPLIFRPKGVDIFPANIYLHFITKLVFNFPHVPKLRKNVCVFRLSYGLKLEVAYHAIRYVVVTVSSTRKSIDADKNTISLYCSALLIRLRQLLHQATQLGTAGFQFEVYFQAPSKRPVFCVNKDDLVSLEKYPGFDALVTEKECDVDNDDCPKLVMWFKSESDEFLNSDDATVIRRAIVHYWKDQWYRFGLALGYNHTEIKANTDEQPTTDDKLQALISLLKQKEGGEIKAIKKLLQACRLIPSPIIESVENELKKTRQQSQHDSAISEFANKVRMSTDRLGGPWQGWGQLPVQVMHTVFSLAAEKPYILGDHLFVTKEDLWGKPKTDVNTDIVRNVLEIWASRKADGASLEVLFTALEHMQLLKQLKAVLKI